MTLVDYVHQFDLKVVEALILLYPKHLKLSLEDLKLRVLNHFGSLMCNL